MKYCFRKISFYLCLCTPFLLSAQSNTEQVGTKFEVFFNVSNALSKATGNIATATTVRTDPNALGFKILPANKKVPIIRFGTNFKVNKNENFTLNRVSQESIWIANLGVEFRKQISPKFEYFYGVDLQYFSSTSSINNIFVGSTDLEISSEIKSSQKGPGVAPLLGLRWNISPRVALYTEGFLGYFFLENSRTVTITGLETSSSRSNEHFFNPIMPGSIVLNITL